jgi:hypothetical protein
MKEYECPHLGCDGVEFDNRAHFIRHLTYWHSATEEEAKEVADA